MIVVAIAHKKSDPDRLSSLARLRANLGKHVHIEDGPGPQDVWSEAMWLGAIAMGQEINGARRAALACDPIDHVCCLNDDSVVPDDFMAVLHAMLSAVPDKCIALSSEHPRGPGVLASGHHWYRCRAWVAGWGYVMPVYMLQEFRVWRNSQSAERLRKLGEDNLINEWHGATGRDTWHPVPSIVKHDIAMRSTYSGQLPSAECNTTVPWDKYPDMRPLMPFAKFWRPGRHEAGELIDATDETPFLLVPSEEARQ